VEGNVAAVADGGRGIVFLLGAGEAAVHAFDHFFDREPGPHVELRGIADFDVADVFGDVVLGEFVGHALEVFGVLEDRAGQAEPAQVIGEVLVLFLEDEFLEAGFRLGRQGHLGGLGQFDQGGEPQRAVQMEVQIGLGDFLEEFAGNLGRHGSLLPGNGCLI